jgi:hypothetical protein
MSDDGFNFWAGAFLIIVIWMLGPVLGNVPMYKVEKAQQLCLVNGGVEKVYEMHWLSLKNRVVCNNGARFNVDLNQT